MIFEFFSGGDDGAFERAADALSAVLFIHIERSLTRFAICVSFRPGSQGSPADDHAIILSDENGMPFSMLAEPRFLFVVGTWFCVKGRGGRHDRLVENVRDRGDVVERCRADLEVVTHG